MVPYQSPRGERGNVLFLILLAVAVLALLTLAISRSSTEQSDILPQQTRDDQINRTVTYASTLAMALHQMVMNGEDPASLYTDLSVLKPGDASFETGSNAMKIYHPLGGGITPLDASSPEANAVATGYGINKGAIIAGVGATDATVGDVVFIAKVANASYCARFNQILTGSSTVPAMDTTAFNSLFGGATVTINAAACASCVNQARMCVSNTGATDWGFYSALFPG